MKNKKEFYFMAFVAVLVLVAVPTPQASSATATPPTAEEGDPVELRLDAVQVDSTTLGLDNAPRAPEAAVSLELDDGSPENSLGVGGTREFLYLNRFTPDPGLFPFDLNEIWVTFLSSTGVGVGDDVYLVVYEDSDGNPDNGALFRAQYSAAVLGLDVWNPYTLPEPLTMTGAGDVLIGVIALETPGSDYYPAALDMTTTQQRSWVGYWDTSPPPYPPTLPPVFGLVDGAEYPGNWMIRGYGETATPPPCYTLTLGHNGDGSDPDATPDNSTGCPTGQYVAGQFMTLSGAAPATGWQIASWYGTDNDDSTASSNTLTMPASAYSAGVNYTQQQPTCYALTLGRTGEGSVPDATPDNSTGCPTGQYVAGQFITLSGAAPATGWQIASWYGTDDDDSTASTNTLTMPASAHLAGVNYTQNEYTVYLPLVARRWPPIPY